MRGENLTDTISFFTLSLFLLPLSARQETAIETADLVRLLFCEKVKMFGKYTLPLLPFLDELK